MIRGLWGVLLLAAINAAAATGATPAAASEGDDELARAARWQEIKTALFADRPVQEGAAWVGIDAPLRALDAALVPVNLTLQGGMPLKGVYLIIDDNPGPLAGHFTFGPDADPHSLKLRVRVNAYTYIHAVAETRDGRLYSAARFVKAAGGCSAPAGGDEQQAVQDLGHIKVRLLQPFVEGHTMEAQLMIRHPNFNGMQMNQVTHLYTPAMFIRTIDVSFDGTDVLHLDSDISLSSDPVISFGFVTPHRGVLKVLVRDTRDATFAQSFEVPAPAG